MWGNIAIAFLLAFIVSFVATPYTIRIANKIGAVDVPKDQRRMHTKAMPKFGGPAVILGVLVSMIYLIAVMTIEGSLDLFSTQQYGKKLLGVLLGVIVIAITGTLDDIKTLKPWQELLGQTIAAIIVVLFGTKIEHLDIPFLYKLGFNESFSTIITVLWIVGVTNAINLIDGLDGLSSGISLISCISLLIIFVLNDSPMIATVIVTAMSGALVGFLPYNFSPAKTFIGDTGSNFLGFMLAIVSILGVAKTYTLAVIVLPVIVLGLPIFDVLFAIVRRIVKGKSIKAVFKPDKGHLHHRLVEKGFTPKQAVLILYGLSASLGMFAIILFDSGIWKALSFLLLIIAAIAMGYRNFIQEQEARPKLEGKVEKKAGGKMKDQIIKFLAYNGKISVVCCSTTNLVEEARKLHDLSPLSTAAMGRVLTITALIGSEMKNKTDKLTIQIKGNGPIGKIVAVSDNIPNVKACITNPHADLPLNEFGKLDVGGAVGNQGFINVIKDIGLKEPYIGISPLTSGEIAEDFANYFETSEQKQTAVALGVLVDKNGVRASGGYIISPMPDATDEEISKIEKSIFEAGAMSKMLDQNLTLKEIAQKITGDKDVKVIDASIEPKYNCGCSKEKFAGSLVTLGEKQLKELIEEDEKAEIKCQFCNKTYQFNKEELEEILKRVQKNNRKEE